MSPSWHVGENPERQGVPTAARAGRVRALGAPGEPGRGVTAGGIASGEDAVAVARRYAESIAGGVIERDRAGAVPARELAAFDASGLLGITVPPEHGGPGLPTSVLAEVVRVIAAVDPAIAQVPQGHYLLVDVLSVHGSGRQRRRLLPLVLEGARLGSALAERGGQHAQDLKTRLRRDGTGALLSGRKYYCTARSRPGGSASARWTRTVAWCSHSPSGTPTACGSTRTGTRWASAPPSAARPPSTT